MTLESLARSSARLAAHDVLRNAAQILTRAGHVEAALILTEPDNWHEIAAKLGADVPACVESLATIGRGTGTELDAVSNDLFGTHTLLVNPRIPLSTGPVFAAWDGQDRGPLPEGSASDIAFAGRNDLEAPAIAQCPVIAQVLDELRNSNPLLARMSGSGATCFALYAREDAMLNAQARIQRSHPHWWTITGRLR